MLHARLDVVYEGLDLITAEVIGDVKAGDNPYLAWADECYQEFSNGGHSGVGKEKG